MRRKFIHPADEMKSHVQDTPAIEPYAAQSGS